jgi:toxin-antitoxin system PIN domain toxin
MIVLDVNVLVAAHRPDVPDHRPVNAWLADRLSKRDGVMVPTTVWVGFVRIITNPRVFRHPSALVDIEQFVDDVVTSPGYVHPSHPRGDIAAFLTLCRKSGAVANLVPDAYFASIALAYGCPVATFDCDFRRFDGLAIITPGTNRDKSPDVSSASAGG